MRGHLREIQQAVQAGVARARAHASCVHSTHARRSTAHAGMGAPWQKGWRLRASSASCELDEHQSAVAMAAVRAAMNSSASLLSEFSLRSEVLAARAGMSRLRTNAALIELQTQISSRRCVLRGRASTSGHMPAPPSPLDVKLSTQSCGELAATSAPSSAPTSASAPWPQLPYTAMRVRLACPASAPNSFAAAATSCHSPTLVSSSDVSVRLLRSASVSSDAACASRSVTPLPNPTAR